MGFSVMGRVLNGVDGEGVPDATVSLNNQIRGKAGGRIHCRVVGRRVFLTLASRRNCNCALGSPQQGGRLLPPGEHDGGHLHHPRQQGAHVLRVRHGEDCSQHAAAS